MPPSANGSGSSEGLFNVSVVLYDSVNREYVIGNAQLPVEDLTDTVQNYNEQVGTYQRSTDKAFLQRTLFLYGTNYSQRENCIIGKVSLDISYSVERQYLNDKEARQYKKDVAENKIPIPSVD
jgi:hypothetical protein